MTSQLETAWAIYSHITLILLVLVTWANGSDRQTITPVGKIVAHLSFFGVVYYWSGGLQ